jgi:ABC-type molybdate transport system substrate-binding protein
VANARISLFSTGVLRTALREAAGAFTDRTSVAVDQTYGNSGKLRERILSVKPSTCSARATSTIRRSCTTPDCSAR